MDGIYLSALIPLLAERTKGNACKKLGMSSSHTMSLDFRNGWLHLHGKPDKPGIWWTEKASVTTPVSPSWEHHLTGAVLEDVSQQGADRVIELRFRERTPYDRGGTTLIFEATGRNSNIILVRREDSRILACLRKVLSRVNRYRSISPGAVYIAPPSSGIPPGEWDSEKVSELFQGAVSPRSIYSALEGVGPGCAKAIISHSADVAGTVRELGKKLSNKNFTPWLSEFGETPVPLGEGKLILNPLAPPEVEETPGEKKQYKPAATELESVLRKRLKTVKKKLASSDTSLERLQSPESLRAFANLILTGKSSLRKGMSQAVLTDWEGTIFTIPLKQSLNPVENAGRYFRKAGKIHLERERLEKRIQDYRAKMTELDDLLLRAERMTDEEASHVLETMRKTSGSTEGGPLEYVLLGGWRCLAGRNATGNDKLTFKVAARNDIWLHARGVAGAHVIIRRDGRAENPSAAAIEQAAQIAAKNSSSNGVVPVDWTLVKYVRRIKGGGPGQVTYSREKTVFAEV